MSVFTKPYILHISSIPSSTKPDTHCVLFRGKKSNARMYPRLCISRPSGSSSPEYHISMKLWLRYISIFSNKQKHQNRFQHMHSKKTISFPRPCAELRVHIHLILIISVGLLVCKRPNRVKWKLRPASLSFSQSLCWSYKVADTGSKPKKV